MSRYRSIRGDVPSRRAASVMRMTVNLTFSCQELTRARAIRARIAYGRDCRPTNRAGKRFVIMTLRAYSTT
jgi:hypothetical protein